MTCPWPSDQGPCCCTPRCWWSPASGFVWWVATAKERAQLCGWPADNFCLTPAVSGCRPGARVAVMEQDIAEVAEATVRQVVEAGLHGLGLESWEIPTRTDIVLSRLGLDGEASLSRRCRAAGGGARCWRARWCRARRCCCSTSRPTTSTSTAIEWLEQLLLEFRGALLFVSHDRAFVDRIATRIIELDRGSCRAGRATTPTTAVARPSSSRTRRRRARCSTSASPRKRCGSARASRRGARATRAACARSRPARERRGRRERLGQASDLAVQEAQAPAAGVRGAGCRRRAIGDKVVVRDFSTRILRGDRIGIVGPNGAGKSTLMKLILGELEPQSGRVARHAARGGLLRPAARAARSRRARWSTTSATAASS
jgi:ATP-binding cassette subfamily F protein uup